MMFSCLFQCIVELCTIFVDDGKNDYNFDRLLNDFEEKKDILIKMSGEDKVIPLLQELREEKAYYTDSIQRLRKRRNKVYVHNDKKFFGDFEKINKELPLFFSDKESLIEFGISSCNRLRDLFNTPTLKYSHMKLEYSKDFLSIINFVEDNYK